MNDINHHGADLGQATRTTRVGNVEDCKRTAFETRKVPNFDMVQARDMTRLSEKIKFGLATTKLVSFSAVSLYPGAFAYRTLSLLSTVICWRHLSLL